MAVGESGAEQRCQTSSLANPCSFFFLNLSKLLLSCPIQVLIVSLYWQSVSQGLVEHFGPPCQTFCNPVGGSRFNTDQLHVEDESGVRGNISSGTLWAVGIVRGALEVCLLAHRHLREIEIFYLVQVCVPRAPTFMTPSSQPLMTFPFPIRKLKGLPRLREQSNTLPFVSFPARKEERCQ